MLEGDDQMRSNFIILLNQEKVNNATIEFRKLYPALNNLAGSMPLLVLNQKKIIAKLISTLTKKRYRAAYTTILDLFIALVKDLRQDMYEPFLNEIMPAVVDLIDTSDRA